MGKIKGITVTLIDKAITGVNELGEEIIDEIPVQVDNVLIAPTSATDIISNTNLTGKKSVYTLAIPKSDNHEWNDRDIIFFNKRYHSYGGEQQGIDSLIPLDWNKKIMVERYE